MLIRRKKSVRDSCRARCVRTCIWQRLSSLMVEGNGTAASVPQPAYGQEPSVGDAKPTFPTGRMETICKPCPREMGAVGQLRRLRVMKKTIYWRTERSGQKKQSCVTRSRRWRMSGRGQLCSSRSQGWKTDVDGEADSRKLLDIGTKIAQNSYAKLRTASIWRRSSGKIRKKIAESWKMLERPHKLQSLENKVSQSKRNQNKCKE